MKRCMEPTKEELARRITDQPTYQTDSGMRQEVCRQLCKLPLQTLKHLLLLIELRGQ